MTTKKPYIIAVLSGILFATSYPPFPAWALFFCFAPVWWVWAKAPNVKEVLKTGFVTQFVFTLIGFNWVAFTAREYGHIPAVLSFLILIGFCCFASLYFALAGGLAKYLALRLRLSENGFFFLVATLTATFEWVYPMIFPFHMSYSLLFSHLKSAQVAEWIGFAGLSVLVCWANALFAMAWNQYPRPRWSRYVMIFVVGLFAVELAGLGLEKNLPEAESKLKVGFVQPNIGNWDKYFAERGSGFQAPIVEKAIALLRQAAQNTDRPDFLVLPETAYPAAFDQPQVNGFYQKMLIDFAREQKMPVVFGAYSESTPQPGKPKLDYNAVFSVNAEGAVSPAYRKHILLAFGEYFPGGEYLPFLKNLIPEISDFGRGPGAMIFDILGAKISPLICYEGLDSQYVGEATRLGAQVFVNVTNDSWFAKRFEPYQHMIMTVGRSVEYRRPLVRVTNTGISTVSDIAGHLLIQSPQDAEWTQTVEFSFSKNPKFTVYSHLVQYLWVLYFALVAGTLFVAKRLL